MSSPQQVKDPVQVDAKHYQVEFENDRVRVLRIKYSGREKSVMHTHPASVAIFLTDCSGRFSYSDGRSEDIQAKAGQVLWMDATEHLPENVTDQPFEVLAIELKK